MTELKLESSPAPSKHTEKTACEVYTRAQHGISRRQIDPEAIKIMYRLIRNGYRAYLVGGGVRDLLLNKTPKDFDIATNATPRRVKDLFRNSRIIGKRFKLIHVFFRGNKIIEVSTFRDISDPIDPNDTQPTADALILRDNKYGTEETDARRRDITINGLFYDISSFSILDYVGGMRDLQAGIIRVIGEPDVRFAEDPVRLIRVIRHACKANFQIEESCYDSICRNAQLITKSPEMRVYEELKKDFVSGYALSVLKLLAQTGVLQHVLPFNKAGASDLFDEGSEFASSLEASDNAVLAGQTRTHTFPLALLALYTKAPFLEAALDEFCSFEAIEEHLNTVFSLLAVPRREKEKLTTLLAGLVAAYGVSDLTYGAQQIHRFELADELKYLGEFLPQINGLSDKVTDYLDSAAPTRSHSSRRRRKSPAHSRH